MSHLIYHVTNNKILHNHVYGYIYICVYTYMYSNEMPFISQLWEARLKSSKSYKCFSCNCFSYHSVRTNVYLFTGMRNGLVRDILYSHTLFISQLWATFSYNVYIHMRIYLHVWRISSWHFIFSHVVPFAVMGNNAQIVEKLLENGADKGDTLFVTK